MQANSERNGKKHIVKHSSGKVSVKVPISGY